MPAEAAYTHIIVGAGSAGCRLACPLTEDAGLRMAREFGRQPALRPFAAAETAPGPDNWSDGALDAHIAATGISVHHPARHLPHG